ncbi:putative GEM-like protein 8 isoform X1 [Salvia miltiorrhiza]|uniref:putative GEM-like protein 8 isoform X1 n=1 Tax=Salvia miltiorrhiza TaxID=226208 RepID=UPI0025AB7916|nr:putative GEM-like protein 8 isoform X1 [Salvia miltiorrhiza]
MEVKHMRTRYGKTSMLKEHAIGAPISSAKYAFVYKNSLKELLPDPAAQYQLLPSPANHYSKIRTDRGNSVIAKMIKLGKAMDVIAQGIREHVRLGPKLSETVKGKLSLGARILQVGGVEKVFKQKFNVTDDEKLLKASQCYLSTTAGPIAGLLFVSTERVAFCSERSIRISSPNGKLLKAHYKVRSSLLYFQLNTFTFQPKNMVQIKLYVQVMIPLRKLKRAHESENAKKPAEKYVHLVTGDNFDFWFMGFLNHQRTLKYLQQVIHQAR